MRYEAGPNLPADVELGENSIRMPSGSIYGLLPGMIPGVLEVFEAAGWIVEAPEPPTFDEVLLEVDARISGHWMSDVQLAVWIAGITEARKRVSDRG